MVEEGIINYGTFHDKNETKKKTKTERESCFYFVIINYARPVTLFLKNEKNREKLMEVYILYIDVLRCRL